MTEAEWQTCTDLPPMINQLGVTGYDRKARLFACACVRCVQHVMAEYRSRRAVEILERHVDGLASWESVEEVRRDAEAVGGNSATCLASEEPVIVAFRAAFEAHPENWPGQVDAQAEQCKLLRDIFGNPFRPVALDPSWLTSTVVGLAEAIYSERAFDRLPILADALEEGGCDNANILDHCRGDGPHVRGCWVVDLILGKS